MTRNCRQCESADIWRGEIARFNTKGVRIYLKEHIGDRLLGTAETPDATPPAEADLVIKLLFGHSQGVRHRHLTLLSTGALSRVSGRHSFFWLDT